MECLQPDAGNTLDESSMFRDGLASEVRGSSMISGRQEQIFSGSQESLLRPALIAAAGNSGRRTARAEATPEFEPSV
jgi:hypothetical protein